MANPGQPVLHDEALTAKITLGVATADTFC
jgi:hypothetical protein